MSETLLALRAALTAAMEKCTDESRLLAAINVLLGQTQAEQSDAKNKKARKHAGHRLDIRGLAPLITDFIHKNGPSTSDAIWESLRNEGQVHQSVELAHIERQLKKQTNTYVLLPSGKWALKRRKIEAVA